MINLKMSKINKCVKTYFYIFLIVAVILLLFYFINGYRIGDVNFNKINITIFAASSDNINKEYFKKSEELISKLNELKNKINVVYGGGKKGLMGEISKYNGNLISSNMKQFVDPSMNDEYLFDNITDRQQKLVDLGDAYIILPGGYGTHYELLQVLTLNDIGVSKKPIIFYNINHFFDEFINYFEDISKKRFTAHNLKELNSHFFDTPDQVIQFIKTII
jgi:uncharacterized protein (TIGR00730 family)